MLFKTMSGRDPRKTWQIINELMSRKTHSSSVKEIKLDNNSIRDPCELSSVFNNYFSSQGPTLINDIHHPTNGPSHCDYIVETEHRFDLKTTEPSKVFTLLSKLCESKASGLDKDFFVSALTLSPILFVVFSIALLQQVFS